MAEATILHVDLDAFYASVEQRLDPTLRGKPIAVGGGVVLAASYEAKRFGVDSGMPVSLARRKCPGLQVVPGHFDQYLADSARVFAHCRNVTPRVEQISIDEAFLDVSGAGEVVGTATEIGVRLRREVRDDPGLALSVGLATTKFLAKVASQVAKPDGMIVVEPDHELEFLHALPVELMWGVGPIVQRRLAELAIETIGDLARTDEQVLVARLGPGIGRRLAALSWNRDPRPVTPHAKGGSVGAQQAFRRQAPDPQVVASVVHHLADRVGSRLRKKGRRGRSISVRVRPSGGNTVSRGATLSAGTDSTAVIAAVATELAARACEAIGGTQISLIGLSVGKLETAGPVQLELELDAGSGVVAAQVRARRRRAVEEALDAVRSRFGKDLAGYAADLGRRRLLPEGITVRDERPPDPRPEVDEPTREAFREDGGDHPLDGPASAP